MVFYDNGGEDGPWGVVSGEAGLAHAGAIVADKSSNVFVTHIEFCGETKIKSAESKSEMTKHCIGNSLSCNHIVKNCF